MKIFGIKIPTAVLVAVIGVGVYFLYKWYMNPGREGSPNFVGPPAP